jgi:hypothetical protein
VTAGVDTDAHRVPTAVQAVRHLAGLGGGRYGETATGPPPQQGEPDQMNSTTLGLLTGLALGFAGAFGGFSAFLIVLVLGALGLVVGRVLDGKLDVSQLTGVRQDRG